MAQGTRRRGLRAALRHAFALPDESLSDEERGWLEKIAGRVVARGMAAPAVVMLESAKPLGSLGSQALVFLRPFISLVVPAERVDRMAALLAKRPAIEELLGMIERLDRERRGKGPLDTSEPA